MEYRIKEYCGTFRIQVKGYVYKGVLWWKRKEFQWFYTNTYGGVRQGFQITSKKFKTLEAAQKCVKEFKKGPIYH